MKNVKLAVAAVAVLVTSSAFAASDFAGGASASDQTEGVKRLKVLPGTGTYAGQAAIRIYDEKATTDNSNGLANDKDVSFAKVDKTASNFFVQTFAKSVLGKDKNTGVTVAHLFKMKGFPWNVIPRMPDHSHLGRMSYGKVGNLDVYYGDWDNTPSGAANVNKDPSKNNYTVFYSGTGKTTNMPTSGTATYAVKGINQHYEQGTAILKGDLTADFGKKTLNGTMSRTGLSIAIKNANINTTDASFGGASTAVATGANGKAYGDVKGNFFGNNAAGLAGIADFGKNNAYNTAFGGTKK
ncbi:Slam-dependent surface lipoprotein [Neisseria bacilliformis]|uniref:Slam-dependent surface lipoprotein n=1 Tax=Neisseria bacilliformis TaxID=267212 RepID=UPI0028F0D5D2|nr:Slam-dependent surface lipoprotein [Neisseria bacilliformis]